MDTPQDVGQRGLQVSKYWDEFLAELNKLFEAQAKLYERLGKVLSPKGEKKESDQVKTETGNLCPIAYEFAINCKVVNIQLNNIQDILDRLEI